MAKEKRRDKHGNVLRKGECIRKDGRYTYAFTDSEHRRHTFYAKNIVELREMEKQIERDRMDGIDLVTASKMTLNDLFDRYIKTKVNLKGTTLANYLYLYNNFVREGFGQRRIVDVRYSDVKAFYQSMLVERGVKANTVDNVHTVLHPAFQLAIRDGILRINPTSEVMAEIKKSKYWEKPKRHALTIPQQKALINFLEETPNHRGWLPIVTVLLGTGMRIGECLGLRWEDVDFKKRVISVNHNLTDRVTGIQGKFERHIQTPKTAAGKRNIPMVDEVMDAFLLEYQIQKCLGFCDEVVDGYSGFIFCNSDKKVYYQAGVNRALYRIREDYNELEKIRANEEGRDPIFLPEFSCHVLRHTFCTRLCENESNLKVIQTIMGHADIQTTMDIYADCTEEKKQEVVANLNGKIIIR